MTGSEIVAHVLAWNSAPEGMPEYDRLYRRDWRTGWVYLTDAGRAIAVDAIAIQTAERPVRDWAKAAAARCLAQIDAEWRE